MKLRDIWLLSVLMFAACRTCPRLHVGDQFTIQDHFAHEHAMVYTVLDDGRIVRYSMHHTVWPTGKNVTSQVERATFIRATKP